MSDLVVREYGRGKEVIITLHGGPAAAGDVAPLARELGKRWRVLEPYQRGSSSQPLSVATHVEDLDDLIEQRTRGSHPILVGHSWGAMLALAYAASLSLDVDALDAQAHEQTWADMVRLQRDGVYPAAFAAIDAPVLMLHGHVDPHPGGLIAEGLRSYIRHLEYLEFQQCGHSPWLERQSRGAFFTTLEAWIGARTRKAE